MKTGAKHIISNAVIFFFITSFAAFFSGCGGEADTVNPTAVSVSTPGTLTGTIYPQIVSVYPANLSTGIPVGTDIIIVFSKPIDDLTIAANVSISGVTAYTVTPINNYYAVVLNITNTTNIPDPTVLAYGTPYTVTILTGITDREVPAHNLNAGGTFSFTTAASTATAQQPRVIYATMYPTDGSTGVSYVLPYVEVTFTDSINPATMIPANFYILPNIASGVISVVAGTNNKTWRLGLNPAAYSLPYTVYLTTSIQSSTTGLFLYDDDPPLLDNQIAWSFTTEPDPATAPYLINDIWVESVTSSGAVIKYTTSKPYLSTNAFIEYDNDVIGAPYAFNQSEGGAVTTTLHTVTLAGLSPGTVYYFRGWLSTLAVYSGDFSFRTANDATVNSVLSNAANNQDGLVLLQTNGLGSYAFWVDNSGDIYGQYFTSAAGGAPQWVPAVTALSTGSTQNGIIAITDGFAEAVIIYNDSNNLYAKMVDTTGLKALWGYVAGDPGAVLGLAIKAGSSYSACIVHERPDIISSGVATMPDNGAAANLLYDADVNFFIYNAWLTAGDLLLTNTTMPLTNWNNYTISNQLITSPYELFPYVLKSSGVTGLGATDYYIADAGVIIAGISDDGNTTTTLICSTGTNLLTVVAGDIVRIGAAEWGVATGSGWTAPYFWVSIDRAIAGLGAGAAFTIYTNHSGPFTSEAVTNPLWDTAPVPLFNPGTTVLAGDYVVNERDNILAALYAQVAAITASDTDYALQLDNNIMSNGDVYSIVRLPATALGRGIGYNTTFATDFNFTDSHAPFGAVAAGDIVYNIDAGLSAMVTAVAGTNDSLTLTADIFNTVTNQKGIVYRKRGFLVTYVDASDYIAARAFNIADGSTLGAAFNVCTAGTNSNPVAVSDGAGNAIIFYEKPAGIYVKKVSAKGDFLWVAPADTSAAAGIPALALAGYTIVQALPDGSPGAISATGGAYLLAKNAAGTQFSLVHVVGDSGAAATVETVAGYDPQMVVDTVAGEAYNRVIIVYRNINVIYYYIQARAYRLNAYNWGPVNVSNLVTYSCYQPSITMADNTTGADSFYVSWFDGRYFNPSGYSIYAKQYTSAGALVGAEQYISMPASMGYDHALYMRLLYYNDSGGGFPNPYGLMPIWLDYRNYAGTGTDIYYRQYVHW